MKAGVKFSPAGACSTHIENRACRNTTNYKINELMTPPHIQPLIQGDIYVQ